MAAPLSDSMRRRLEKEQEAYDSHGAVAADETDGAYPALPSDLADDEAMKQKGGFLQLNVSFSFLWKIRMSHSILSPVTDILTENHFFF